jgi:hypothetical protein
VLVVNMHRRLLQDLSYRNNGAMVLLLVRGDAMSSQVTDNATARRSVRQPRRVRLEPVVRRDAAQRLQLALTLVARLPVVRQPLSVPANVEECSA